MHFTFWGHYSHENGLNLLEIACFFGQFFSKVNIGLLKYVKLLTNCTLRNCIFDQNLGHFCNICYFCEFKEKMVIFDPLKA